MDLQLNQANVQQRPMRKMQPGKVQQRPKTPLQKQPLQPQMQPVLQLSAAIAHQSLQPRLCSPPAPTQGGQRQHLQPLQPQRQKRPLQP